VKTYKTVKGLQRRLAWYVAKKKRIGFVPTMGALHKGHLSLIQKSTSQNDITVVSIFVNPTQFNDKSDLTKYPRTVIEDSKLLKSVGCSYLFLPAEKQVYPQGESDSIALDISELTKYMEGPNRPGHFEGVVQVVHRLLSIVNPSHLYMGQKDFQQFTIIAHMLHTLKMKTKLVVCPIKRADDGLAMSSRNVRLKKKIRTEATVLFETLSYVKVNQDKYTPAILKKKAIAKLSIPQFRPEYFVIADGHTLKPVKKMADHKYVVACTAVWAGKVRLIDNMILKEEG